MTNPSRREKLEEMLAENPGDDFLEYGLAVEYLNEGELGAGLARLRGIIDRSPDYCAAYFRAGQALAADERWSEARTLLEQGIAAAERVGDLHAAGEMREALAALPPAP
jgi:hypothetical protein